MAGTEEVNELIFGFDIDGTLTAGWGAPEEQASANESLGRLHQTLTDLQAVSGLAIKYGTVTGNTTTAHGAIETQNPAFGEFVAAADFKITSGGADIHLKDFETRLFRRVSDWPNVKDWQPAAIHEYMRIRTELKRQPAISQNPHRISYIATEHAMEDHTEYEQSLVNYLRLGGLDVEVVCSAGQYVDLMPKGVHKGSALMRTTEELGMPEALLVAAGDTMNDRHSLLVADCAIVPGNAEAAFIAWAKANIPEGRLFIADRDARFALGVLRGMQHFGLVG